AATAIRSPGGDTGASTAIAGIRSGARRRWLALGVGASALAVGAIWLGSSYWGEALHAPTKAMAVAPAPAKAPPAPAPASEPAKAPAKASAKAPPRVAPPKPRGDPAKATPSEPTGAAPAGPLGDLPMDAFPDKKR